MDCCGGGLELGEVRECREVDGAMPVEEAILSNCRSLATPEEREGTQIAVVERKESGSTANYHPRFTKLLQASCLATRAITL